LTVRLLLTRPEPDAARTAAGLRALGHEVIIAPLLRIEPVADLHIDEGPWAAIVVTSANVARAPIEQLRHIPVFAVGGRSAQAMREAGFAEVRSADGHVDDLARLVANQVRPTAPLLYLAGEHRTGDLAGELRKLGFAVEIKVVYCAVAATVLSPAAADALAIGLDAVLHFSRRSAEAYIAAAEAAGLRREALQGLAHYCLSAQVAEPLAHAGADPIRIATRPVEASLLDLIGAA